jgi:hypothetical protein
VNARHVTVTESSRRPVAARVIGESKLGELLRNDERVAVMNRRQSALGGPERSLDAVFL